MSSDLELQRLLDDPQADLSEVALLRAGKAEVMSDETRRKVLAGAGVGGAALGLHLASVSSSVSHGSAGWAAWPAWLKTGLLLSALGGVAGSLAFFGLGSEPPSVQQPAQPNEAAPAAPPAKAEPVNTEAANGTAAAPVYQATDLPVEPVAPVTKPGKPSADPALPAEAAGEPSLAAEMDAIRPAKARLAAGDAAGALALVRQYRAQFPRGRLTVEATVIEIEALVASGQRAAAEKLAAPLLKGNSPYAARLRSLLGSSPAPAP